MTARKRGTIGFDLLEPLVVWLELASGQEAHRWQKGGVDEDLKQKGDGWRECLSCTRGEKMDRYG